MKIVGGFVVIVSALTLAPVAVLCRGIGFICRLMQFHFTKGMDDYDTLADKVRTP
jgi:hypothetical protein